MARDSVTVDFLLNTRNAEKDLARIRKEMERLGVAGGKALKGFGGTGGGGDKIRALGTGLSKATVRADEFTKSLEASNARVVAFGASTLSSAFCSAAICFSSLSTSRCCSAFTAAASFSSSNE